MKVLSLFDGISGAQAALKSIGIKPDLYVASEINPHAIKITQGHFPKTIQVGDIETFYNSNGHLKFGDFDLLIFGSPCTDLSVAKKNRQSLQGKSSGLFYLAHKIFCETNPTYYFMENVATMSDASRKEISELMGVEPVEINSSLFVPQNRRRLYWTNLPCNPIEQAKYAFSDVLLSLEQLSFLGLELSEFGYAYMDRKVKDGRSHWDFGHHSDSSQKTSACVVSNFKKGVPYNVLLDKRFKRLMARKFHPLECERLQGLTDSYTKGISDTARYEAIGNCFTIPAVAHFLKNIKL